MPLGAAAQAAVDGVVAATTAYGSPGVDRTALAGALAALVTGLAGEPGLGTVRFVCDVGPTDADLTHLGNVPLTAADIPCTDPFS